MPIEPSIALGLPRASEAIGGQPAWLVGRLNAQATFGRWQGGTWRRVASPWSGDIGLTGVSAVSPSVAWAVGYTRLHRPRAVSARWNGSSWQADAVPHPGGEMAVLTDVAALGGKRALAVGYRLSAGRVQAVALLRTKRSWTTVSPDFGSLAESGLTSVSLAPDGKVWAVGWRTNAGRPVPWIGYWNGSAWNQTPAAPTDPGLAYLNDVEFGSSTHGWTVGYLERDDGSGYEPLLQRWDGAHWNAEPSPWPAAPSVVLATVGIAQDGSVHVGGQVVDQLWPRAVLASLHGGNWQVTPARNDPYPGSWTLGASGLADRAFVAGYFGSDGGVLAGCESSETSTGRPKTVADVPSRGSNASQLHEDSADTRTATQGSAEVLATTQLAGYEARDMTSAAGLTMNIRTSSSVAADFNDDGWTDLFINPHAESEPLLELGSASGFSVVPTNFDLTDRYGCAVADATGDDELDLFCAVGRRQGTAMGTHEFMVNLDVGGGTLATEAFGLLDITGRGRAAAFVHLAADPLPSLFIANWPFRIDGLPSFNRFYRNVDGTHFVPAPEAGLDTSAGGQCVVAANVDADADDELLLCTTEAAGGKKAGIRLYDFDGTRFVDRTAQWGISPFADVDVEVADFDGDGRPDIAQLSGTRLRISLGTTGGSFVKIFELATKKQVKMAVGDVNEDERPDIYISRHAGNNDHHLMLVNGGNGRSFTSIAIPQARSGSADDVIALDYDNNGLTDFLTLNGLYTPGPLKLIAFFPAGQH